MHLTCSPMVHIVCAMKKKSTNSEVEPAPYTRFKITYRSKDDVILDLLVLDKQEFDLIGEIGNSGVEITTRSTRKSPFDLALDLLGVPSDNTCEFPIEELQRTEGRFPHGIYSREFLSDIFFKDKDRDFLLAAKRFVNWVRMNWDKVAP